MLLQQRQLALNSILSNTYFDLLHTRLGFVFQD